MTSLGMKSPLIFFFAFVLFQLIVGADSRGRGSGKTFSNALNKTNEREGKCRFRLLFIFKMYEGLTIKLSEVNEA